MSLYSNATITRFAEESEREFNAKNPSILKRYGLAIVSGTGLYTLPTDIISIRKITYRGVRLYPYDHRRYREQVGYPMAGGFPRTYVFNNVGEFKVQLLPTPNENISATQTDLFTPSVILVRCIVEYWATPDFTGSTYRIPSFLRRRLQKAGVNAKSFALEGRGKDNKGAAFWEAFYKEQSELYSSKLNDLLRLNRRIQASNLQSQNYMRVGRLPSNFGSPVDYGE